MFDGGPLPGRSLWYILALGILRELYMDSWSQSLPFPPSCPMPIEPILARGD